MPFPKDMHSSSRGPFGDIPNPTFQKLNALFGPQGGGGGRKNGGHVDKKLAALLMGRAGKSSDTVDGNAGSNFFQSMFSGINSNLDAMASGKIGSDQNPGDPMDALFNQLMTSLGGGGGTYDYETALQQSEQAIRDAYQKDINAIKDNNRRARRQTAADRKDIEAMYGALARDYMKTAKISMKQGEHLADKMQGVSKKGTSIVKKNANRILNQQAAMAENLGIEESMPEIAAVQQNKLAKQLKGMTAEGSRDARKQLKDTGTDQRFFNRGSTGARLEGTNRSADLLSQLRDFVHANMNNIASLKGQRGKEIATNKNSVMASVAQMQQEADNQMWDRLMGLAGLKLDIENTQADNNLATAKYRSSLRDGNSSSSSADSPFPSNVQDMYKILSRSSHPKRNTALLDQITATEPFADNRFQSKSGEYLDLSGSAAANEAEKAARAAGVTNPNELKLIRLAAMAYAQGN